MKLKTIKSTDLARALGMSLRHFRRYEYGERPLELPTLPLFSNDIENAFHFAKLGVLTERLASPSMPDEIYEFYDCKKRETEIQNSITELERLIRVGKYIGAWYLSEAIKEELIG